MSAKEFAEMLRKIVVDMKANGTEEIHCDNLIAYSKEVIDSPSPIISNAEMERFKTDLQILVEQTKATHFANLEMFKSVIEAGHNAIKASFLLNGGSAVALLAFISKLTELHKDKVPEFAGSLKIFVIGVFLVTVVSGVTYLSQWFYAGYNGWKTKVGFWLNVLAIILGLSSYGVFIWGMCNAYNSFLRFI